MNIIFSSWNISNYTVEEVHMAQIANFLAQKHGYKTILYCEERSKDLYKNIPYNEVKILPEKIINEIPRELWSMSKIIALSEIEEPSLVIDFDLFLFKPLEEQKLNNDIIYFHDELYSPSFVDPLVGWFGDLKPDKIKNFQSNISLNCAMIGGQDFKTIKNVAKEIVEDVVSKKDIWTKRVSEESKMKYGKKYYPKDPNPWFVPVLLIEQVWMFDLYKYYNKQFTPYLERADDFFSKTCSNGIFHLWGLKSQHILSICREFVNSHIDYDMDYEDFVYNPKYLKEIRKHLEI